MAAEPVNEHGAGMDMPAHVRDYSLFTAMLKWGAIVSFIVAAFVVLIIS